MTAFARSLRAALPSYAKAALPPASTKACEIALAVVFALLLALAAISIMDFLLLRSVGSLVFAAGLIKVVPLALIVAGIAWRFAEISGLSHPAESRVARIPQFAVWFAVCLLSALACNWIVLAAQIGVTTPNGISDNVAAIGGVMPFADAKLYYGAAINMARFDLIGEYGSRRPIHSAVLSLVFLLTHFDRLGTILAQASLVGASLGLLCLTLSRMVGAGAALVVWSITYLLVIDFLPTFMSEPTGMWLGFLGLALALGGLWSRMPSVAAIGIGVLMLGFSARAGAILLIPAFFLVGLWTFRHDRRELRIFAWQGALAIGIAVLIPALAFIFYNTQGGQFQGNASYFLYQLSVGSEDWRQIIRDYPDAMTTLVGGNRYAFIYARAFENILQDPTIFVATYFKILFRSITFIPEQLIVRILDFYGVPRLWVYRGGWIWLAYSLFVTGWVSLVTLPGWRRDWRLAVILISAAYAASLPLMWIGTSVRSHAVTFPLLALVFAGLLARPSENRGAIPGMTAQALGFAAYLAVLLAFMAPGMYTLATYREPPRDPAPNQIYLSFGPHTPLLRLMGDHGRHIRPDIAVSEFMKNPRVRHDYDTFFSPLKPGDQLVVGFDEHGNHHYYWSKPFCIPDRNWTFLATITPTFPPELSKIDSLVPIGRDWKPLPKNAPLPYGCLYGKHRAWL
jgi:hypothetical protein